jgi:murein peptide amidase A
VSESSGVRRPGWSVLIALLIASVTFTGCLEARTGPPPAVTTTTATTAPVQPSVTPTESPAPTPAQPAAAAERAGSRTIGASVQGRSIELRTFGTGPRHVLVVGGIHGNEYGADVTEAFVTAVEVDPSLVPAGARLDVITSLNPDGRAADSRGNANSVELNRNMPASTWQPEIDENDSAYGRAKSAGTAAGSEPETKAFISALDAGGYAAVVMLHSQGGLLDYDGAGGRELAERMSESTGLPVKHLAYQKYIHGSVGQFVPERYNIPVITVELSSRKLTKGMKQALLSVLD